MQSGVANNLDIHSIVNVVVNTCLQSVTSRIRILISGSHNLTTQDHRRRQWSSTAYEMEAQGRRNSRHRLNERPTTANLLLASFFSVHGRLYFMLISPVY